MTTISYNHEEKRIASDSRITCGNVIACDHADKFIFTYSEVFFFSGNASEHEHLIDIYLGKKEPCKNAYECTLMMCERDSGAVSMITYSKGNINKWRLTYSDSIGSGSEFAIAAMDFGKSARESVEYAATRDSKTGGKVKVFDTESWSIIQS